MKSKILGALRSAEDYVSGQELCENFGVTRTAIWKAMNQLKEEGYEIEAVSNKGYRLKGCPDSVKEEELLSRLNTKWAGQQIAYIKEVDSTNNYARRLAENGAVHGTLAVTDRQYGGKGRRGKSWSMPDKSSVAMTLILRPQMNPGKASMLTLVMGLAVARGVNRIVGRQAKIKWPNDVVLNGRKICGILTEMSAEMEAVNYIVIGAGINVNMDEMPEEIAHVATSLSMECGREIHRAQVIQYCMEEFERCYDKFMETQDLSLLLEEYNDVLVNKGNMVKVLEPGNEYTGMSDGINSQGELLVTKENGDQVRVFAGEVSVRGFYGYV